MRKRMPKKLAYQELEDRIEALEKENTALQKSNDKLLHILNSMTEGYTETDLEGNLLLFNDITPIYHGRTREEMTGLNYREFTPPEQVQEIFRIYNRVYRTGLTEKVKEFQIIRKDGSIGTVDATVSLLRDDSGRPIGFSTFSLEVTDRKRVKDALEEREETYRKIIEAAPDDIMITRRSDGRYLEVNESFGRHTGYSQEEVLGRTALELNLYVNPADRQKLVEANRKYGQVDGMQITFQAKDGSLLHDLVSTRIIQYKGEECVLIVATVITPLIEAQKAIQESEERYRMLLETAPDSIVIRRLKDNIYLEVNDAFCQRSGYSREEALGRTPEELGSYIMPGDAGHLRELLQKNNGQVDGYETRYRNRHGVIRDLLVSARVIQYQGQECILAISKNITDLKNAQKALQNSEERYRKILETMEEGYYECDLAGNITFFNEALCRTHGYPPEELLGLNFRQFTVPSEKKRIISIFNNVYRTGVPVRLLEHEIISKDGSKRFAELSISLMRNESGEPVGFSGIVRDVMERKEAQLALQKSEERYRKILETMEEGYYEVDLRGTFTFFNLAECRIHQCTPEEMKGLNNRQFSSPETARRVYKIYNEVYRTGVPAKIIDYDVIRKDGSVITLETSASLLKDSEGNPLGFYGISRDITERKRVERELEEYRENLEKMVRDRARELEKAQEELVKREKLAVLGQLTATVSHELRNPLGVIRSSNFYLHRKVHQKNEKIEKHFRRIEEQVGLCDSIVADLLEYTRGRHVETVRRSLTAWLEPLLDELFEQEKITLARDISASLSIPHDQEKMRRVIINVMNNAIQATQARQQNWRDKEKPYNPEIFIGLRSEDSGIIIEIKDNGTGMDQETLKRAFEPLFTTRARGTGLGLANVEKIISEHQGLIVLESEPDHGTRVTIFLPDKATNHC